MVALPWCGCGRLHVMFALVQWSSHIATALQLVVSQHDATYYNTLPVKVASTDEGAVSIWHMPGAEHSAEHGCASLLDLSYEFEMLQFGQVRTRINEMSQL